MSNGTKVPPNKSLFGTSAGDMKGLFHQEQDSDDNYRDSDDNIFYYWSEDMEDDWTPTEHLL